MSENIHVIQGAKGGEDKPHTPYETPNNLLSVAYAKVLMAVAEGELAGTPTAQDIFLDGTPLANPDGSLNFGGVTWEWRSGRQDQEYIKGLPEVSTEYSIGTVVDVPNSWVRAITRPNLSAIRITFAWQGLQTQKQNGDVVGSSMEYAVDFSVDGGPFVEYGKYTVIGKTNTEYRRTQRFDLPDSNSNNWIVRVRRLTPDSTSQTEVNAMRINSYTEVIDVKQTYPNTALLYVEFDSRTFGAGAIPQISVRTRGRLIQVPDNYNPETRDYTGVWSGSFKYAWTDNPAWVFYDLLTQQRFGLGHRVTPSMVDKFAMYVVAQYCDVMVPKGDGSGDMEPRHTCNIFIQEQNDAWQVLRDIASIFNGMTYWNGNQFVAIADKEENIDNIPVFSRSNVVNGRFDYNASDEKSIYTSALISYDDPSNRYESAVESTFERSQILRWGGDRQVTISAIGCTSRGEAQRRGKYTLLTNLYNRLISFQTGMQGLNKMVLPGSIIHVADPLIGGKPFTGRIKMAVGTVITLDRTTEAKAGDLLYITRKNGITEGRRVRQRTGDVVQVDLPYTELPEPNAVWYLESADLKSQLYRVTKITNPKEGVYEISGVEYNESKYRAIDTGARLEPRPISLVPDRIQEPVSEVNIVSRTYVEQTLAVTTMTISWPQARGATSYEVQWRTDDGDWVNVGVTGANEIDVKGIYAGQYIARVRARNASNIASVWTNSMLTNLAGKTGSPPAITSLRIDPMFFGMRLDWTFPDGAGDTLRTEIMYSENSNFASATKLGDFAYPQDSHELHGLRAGQGFYFWVRLIDRTGNIGPWFPTETGAGIFGRTMINDDGAYNDYLAGLIGETALDKQLYDRLQLIDGNGPGSVNERLGEINDKLDSAVSDLEQQLNDITDAFAYDPTKTYAPGEFVRFGSKLYQAIADVPLDTPPPSVDHWKDVGVILEEADALAERVNIHDEQIEEIDGVLQATVRDYEAIRAQYREDDGEGDLLDALNSYTNRASIIEERTVRANEDEALAERIVTIQASTADNAANITTVERALADQEQALSERIDRVSAETTTKIGDLEETVNVTIAAQIATETKARTDADAALGSRIDIVSASVTTERNARTAAISSEQTARVDADTALGRRVDTVSASVVTEQSARTAAIKTEQDARIAGDTAISRRVDTIEAGLITDTQVQALIQVEADARVTGDEALATRITTVQTTAGQNSSSIQTLQTTTSNLDGKVSAAYTVKIEAQSNGQYVAAGIGLGVENGPAGLQSQFLVRADRFAVVSGLNGTTSAPFVVQNGQVFINDALINKATITSAIIGSYIYSSQNSTWGGPIMQQEFNSGYIRLLHATRNATYTELSRTGLNVFVDGVLRVRMGAWE